MTNRIARGAVLGMALVGFVGATLASDPRPAPHVGVYRWANQATNVDAFERWLDGPLVWAEDFVGSESWDNVAWPVWWLEGWSKWKLQKSGRRLILSIPLLPGPWDGSGPKQGDARGERVSLEDGAAGKYNHHCYFDVQAPDGHHQLSLGASGNEQTEFPRAAAKFKELFGARP
jgi:hypothetical protein